MSNGSEPSIGSTRMRQGVQPLLEKAEATLAASDHA